jgi:hypothetical protein
MRGPVENIVFQRYSSGVVVCVVQVRRTSATNMLHIACTTQLQRRTPRARSAATLERQYIQVVEIEKTVFTA